MPAGQAHRDTFSRQGARLVVVEAEAAADEQAHVFTDWGAVVIAERMRHELDLADAFSSLALEGLALELAALVARRAAVREAGAPWLKAETRRVLQPGAWVARGSGSSGPRKRNTRAKRAAICARGRFRA